MNMPQTKKRTKTASGMSGSLAYYQLLAGMSFIPKPLASSRSLGGVSSNKRLLKSEETKNADN